VLTRAQPMRRSTVSFVLDHETIRLKILLTLSSVSEGCIGRAVSRRRGDSGRAKVTFGSYELVARALTLARDWRTNETQTAPAGGRAEAVVSESLRCAAGGRHAWTTERGGNRS
jgi:hypothetical protein